jgi:hypothetical protein
MSDDDDEVFICHSCAPADTHLLADVVAVDDGIVAWLARRRRVLERRAGLDKALGHRLPGSTRYLDSPQGSDSPRTAARAFEKVALDDDPTEAPSEVAGAAKSTPAGDDGGV